MKSKNIKTKAKKISKEKPKSVAKKAPKAAVTKATSKTSVKSKGQNKNKKFFPKDAKPAAQKKIVKTIKTTKKPDRIEEKKPVQEKAVVKRAPWAKKPVENIHSTPANAGYSMRSEFDKYIAKKYKKLKDDQIKSLWITVSSQMLAEPNLKLLEVVDNCLTKK